MLSIKFTEQQKINFLKELGYTVINFSYKSWHCETRSSDDYETNHSAILAFKETPSDELKSIMNNEYNNDFNVDYFLAKQEGLEFTFNKEITERIISLILKQQENANKDI